MPRGIAPLRAVDADAGRSRPDRGPGRRTGSASPLPLSSESTAGFPSDGSEIDRPMVREIARQVHVPGPEDHVPNLSGRTAERHRAEVRVPFGSREATVADAECLKTGSAIRRRWSSRSPITRGCGWSGAAVSWPSIRRRRTVSSGSCRGLDHRFGHRSSSQAADRFRVERGAAGRAGTSSRSRTYSNRSWGLAPKKRSAAVVPSGRRIR